MTFIHPGTMSMPALALAVLLGTAAAGSCQAQARYDNPVDKQTYVTSGEFKTYQPATPRVQTGRVVTDQVILLTGEPDLKLRTTAAELATFLKGVESVAFRELDKNKLPAVVMIQFNCVPDRCDVKMASQGDAEEVVLQNVYNGVSGLKPPKVSGDVRFQIQLRVRA